MLLSLLLYSGAAATACGAAATVRRRTRRQGLVVFGAGIASMLVAALWPARERRVERVVSRLDSIIPRCQFQEHHEIRIAASPERIYSAIRLIAASEIRFFQILTAIRRLGRGGEESIINAPGDVPILDVATRTGFRLLADEGPREIVFGLDVSAATFAVMNFQVGGDGLLTTETRVVARSDAARRSFALYWRLIRPGSGIIRRSWLEAIKRRAEAMP